MAGLKDRIRKLLGRKATGAAPINQKQVSNPSVSPSADGAQLQSIPQLDGLFDSHQKVVKPQSRAATATGQLQVQLQNRTNSSTVYAYITGQAINHNNAIFLLQADAKTPYYPPNPSSTGTKLAVNVSIPLGAPGNSVTATIPQLAGGRIWFSIGAPLIFTVNPGPGLVEPSIFNPADPNHNTNFGFAEITFNSAQVFVNISYVDFVGPPVSLTLLDTAGATQHVSGMPANGIQTVANGLTAQTQKDGRRWSSLIVNDNAGKLLRILSPNSGILLNPTWFQTYYTDYVNQVYSQYSTRPLTVNTQASFGNVNGQVGSLGNLNFGAGGLFAKPTSADIFSCSTGPFAIGQNGETNTIIPRLAAAFNRSTLLLTNTVPNGEKLAQYYTNPITNHYARIVHAANLDGKGYAFPYDDVVPDGGVGQEGALFSYSPTLLTVAVGGNGAFV
ncbi:hypothetical protein LTR56_012655 [Elasticomyces elasticus]|nr:hypothetical protein LTR56_012655 [Elasticomyces elasticus]KAK3668288.1 hypothetical protein LTR22_000973 [Elasticomyces elasticus]KAK4922779.1 hypothetical protein LTR49_009967 [Elasticomyces elasticus]KAK5769387.1 hypothetical protein LTS12_000314 [Elasticomyces elasticus]